MTKRPDIRIQARSDVGVVRVAIEQARTPTAEVTLDPSAVRELIRELSHGLDVALGVDVTRTNDDGDPVAWTETVGYSLAAFAPAGAVR